MCCPLDIALSHRPGRTRSLHKVHDEDGKKFELEVSWICDESNKQHTRVSEGREKERGLRVKS